MLSAMEDILQVSTRRPLRQNESDQSLLQTLISSKSSKAEGYRTFRDEVVNTLKSHPELAGDERLGKAITRVSRVGGS